MCFRCVLRVFGGPPLFLLCFSAPVDPVLEMLVDPGLEWFGSVWGGLGVVRGWVLGLRLTNRPRAPPNQLMGFDGLFPVQSKVVYIWSLVLP